MNSTITAANRPEGATNPLYIRMRNRFDFSGNRTIGEFMTMKANREGYCAPTKSAAPRRAASHRPLVSLVSLLLSAVVLLVCAIGVAGAVSGETSTSRGSDGASVLMSQNSDPAALSLVFRGNDFTSTIEE